MGNIFVTSVTRFLYVADTLCGLGPHERLPYCRSWVNAGIKTGCTVSRAQISSYPRTTWPKNLKKCVRFVCISVHVFVCARIRILKIYVCIPYQLNIYIYACMHTCVCAGERACVRTYIRVYVHACIRACVYACMRACVHRCMRTYVHACMRACVHACMRA